MGIEVTSTDDAILGLESVKKLVQSITRKIQRSGSLEWYVLHEEYNYQILYVYTIDDLHNPMPEHFHESSSEYFIILNGKLEINSVIYSAGQVAVITPGQPHYKKPLTADLKMITVLHPPEAAYKAASQ
jgi:quercetin dioxygenase-like cupin family protein